MEPAYAAMMAPPCLRSDRPVVLHPASVAILAPWHALEPASSRWPRFQPTSASILAPGNAPELASAAMNAPEPVFAALMSLSNAPELASAAMKHSRTCPPKPVRNLPLALRNLNCRLGICFWSCSLGFCCQNFYSIPLLAGYVISFLDPVT